MNSKSTIAIIGVGSRGLSVLERIVACALEEPSRSLHVHLFDTNPPGSGCHSTSQPSHLLVNTVAEQITQFSDPSVKNSGPILEGPSFYEWLLCQSRELGSSEEISPNGYYARSLFGGYLEWVFHYLLELAPKNICIEFHKEEVVDISDQNSGVAWMLYTSSSLYAVDYLFLTTGHTEPEDNELYQESLIKNPYPIDKLDFISAGSKIVVEGMGLTFFDIVSHLTQGRGGYYEISGTTGRFEYVRSGREPCIIAYSRSGLPLLARAVNQKGVSGQYQAHFLTVDKIEELKKKKKICFISDVFPELLNDMQYAYYFSYIKKKDGVLLAKKFCSQFKFLHRNERDLFVSRNITKEDRFSWSRLVDPIPENAKKNKECFNKWYYSYLLNDLREAHAGNIDSPIKAACDVLRDLRDNIRSVIDFGKLTEESQRWLYKEFVPVMNRVSVGPPKERLEEMLALIDAGILICNLGSKPYVEHIRSNDTYKITSTLWPDYVCNASMMVKARIPMHSPENDKSPLIKSMLSKGYARIFYNGAFHPGGLDIDQTFNLINRNGKPASNAWVLGMPAEGAKFYTFVVPRPGVNSTAIVDAGNAVKQIFLAMACHSSLDGIQTCLSSE